MLILELLQRTGNGSLAKIIACQNESLTEAQYQPHVRREQDSLSGPCYPQGVPDLRAVNACSLRYKKGSVSMQVKVIQLIHLDFQEVSHKLFHQRYKEIKYVQKIILVTKLETDYGSNGHFSMYSLMKICIDLCYNLFLFNILKYHIEKRMSSKIAKFADDTQISKTLRARTNCDEIFLTLRG